VAVSTGSTVLILLSQTLAPVISDLGLSDMIGSVRVNLCLLMLDTAVCAVGAAALIWPV
jgi:hypothetical protein